MEFKCSVKDLQNAVGNITKVIAKKTALDILTRVYIKTEANTVVLRGTDFASFTVSELEAEVTGEGAALVEGQLLLDILSKLRSEKMVFSYNEDTQEAVITGDKVTFQLSNQNKPEQYPQLDEISKENYVTVAPADLKKAIACTKFAADDKNGTREFLKGIHMMTVDMTLKLIATDNHRLSIYSCPVIEKNQEVDAVVPVYVADMISGLIDDNKPSVNLYFSKKSVSVESMVSEYSGGLIDLKYPDVNRAVPADCKTVITVPRDSLLAAMDSMEVASRTNSYICFLKASDGELTLFSQSLDGSIKAKAVVDIETDGDSVEFGVNIHYAREAVSIMETDTIEIRLNGNDMAFVLKESKNDNFLHVLMPLALTDKDKKGMD
ncbi:MAG: DNA polymerase III subunit beta [Abditibacteriota bacterium]|nr:DNA polymerase III subunit beta [Abditibacteriota bacterium]